MTFNRKKDKLRRQKQELQKARKNEKALEVVAKHLSTDRNGDLK